MGGSWNDLKWKKKKKKENAVDANVTINVSPTTHFKCIEMGTNKKLSHRIIRVYKLFDTFWQNTES